MERMERRTWDEKLVATSWLFISRRLVDNSLGFSRIKGTSQAFSDNKLINCICISSIIPF